MQLVALPCVLDVLMCIVSFIRERRVRVVIDSSERCKPVSVLIWAMAI